MYAMHRPAPGFIPVTVDPAKRTQIAGLLTAEMAYWPGSDWWFMVNDDSETIGFWFSEMVARDLLESYLD